MMEIKKRSPHYHRLDDYELRFHLSKGKSCPNYRVHGRPMGYALEPTVSRRQCTIPI